MPPLAPNVEALVPHLSKCGYSDAQIARPFKVGETTIDVAAFAGKPWDNWSACLAAVELEGDSKSSAAKAQYLGATSVFVCSSLGIDWYGLGPSGPTAPKQFKWADVPGFFRVHKSELAPSAIYDAKLRRPTANPVQMTFFDVGLMPAVERNRSETLLRLVENAISGLHYALGAKLNSRQAQEDVYRTVFWQLAAKVLHDKGVPNFKQIDLNNVDQVFDRVGRHHGVTDRLPPSGNTGRTAIDAMAASIAGCGSLADVSSESIAYVYENALLDKAAGNGKSKTSGVRYDIRKELGIHSTPPVLIQHMLSKVWRMVEEIAPADRVVFEPACGHAPFLTAAMRWLRSWDTKGESKTNHDYMRKHLRGVEADPFAIELGKLALTLADEPHGNSWAIQQQDMFAPGVLETEMTKESKDRARVRILLSNPPYEAFTDTQRKHYRSRGEEVTAKTKAVEMLKRTLPYLPPGGVFGVVMPLGILHDKESKSVREELLREFDVSEISVFADSLFEHGDHEVAVLMGRKKKPHSSAFSLMYRRVREAGMDAFKERLAFSWEREILQTRFAGSKNADMWVPELEDLWMYLGEYPTLDRYATVGQGLSYHGRDLPRNAWTIEPYSKGHGVPGFAKVLPDLAVYSHPTTFSLNLDRAVVRRPHSGATTGIQQVVLNYHPVSRGPWRLKPFIDLAGHAVTSSFLAVRPRGNELPLNVIWAALNSPISNAFVYCHLHKRNILSGKLKQLPFPSADPTAIALIDAAARRYQELAQAALESGAVNDTRKIGTPSKLQGNGDDGSSLFDFGEVSKTLPVTGSALKDALLAMDAAVLRAYALPVRLERQLLDLFNGAERKGVGCTFGDYYPGEFKSLVPLHKYISTGYRGSTVDQVAARMKPDGSSAGTAALRAAAEAFGGDD